MKRRELLGAGAAGVVALSMASASAFAQDHAQEKAGHHDKTHEDCLKACGDCAKMCDETFHHCLMLLAEGKKEHAKPLQYVSDCAGFCALSACMIAKHSPLMAHSCGACAESCKETAAVVEKFDSPEMKAAAKALHACEDSCRAMVKAMGEHAHHEGHGESK